MSDDHLPTPTGPGTQPSYAQPYYSPANLYAPRVSGAHIAIAWICAVIKVGYFLPWAIAATRQKSNTLAIGLVNLLVGWTVIGWVVALVMACLSETPPVHVHNVPYVAAPVAQQPAVAAPAGWYPVATGGQRYWDGQSWTDQTAP
jgi:hypothetical protein